MLEYRMDVIICWLDKTWTRLPCVYLGDDKGDRVAIAAMEQQARSVTGQVAFYFPDTSSLQIIEEDYDDEGDDYEGWLGIARRIAQEQGKVFENDTAKVAWEKDYTPSGFVNTFAYYEEDDDD